ncbi:Hypothetical predicted protein [Xyrichtys novacula]|uniref:Uncharacterized protein n=1 Tax=Xyrichtys novacula TaxID=13765 RepID=A0AAV1EIL9_XYRNO|nr:Hypothetical predicted protein [Xyrichtys novacula]
MGPAVSVEWHCPLQKNTNTQERKIKGARSGNGSQHSDPESPQNDHHNTTLRPSLTEAEDQDQSELTRKAPQNEDEEGSEIREEANKVLDSSGTEEQTEPEQCHHMGVQTSFLGLPP